jgi:non-heme chloroperoxidase
VRRGAALLVILTLGTPSANAAAQTESCEPVAQRAGREFGCFITAREALGRLPRDSAFYWHIDAYPSRPAALAAKGPRGTVVESLGRTWLFTIAGSRWGPREGEHIATVGPLALVDAGAHAAVYMEGVFRPGMHSPVHRHPGVEAWYTLEGEQCLETPRGRLVQRAGDSGVMVPGGEPMMLTGTGSTVRRSLVLILQDASKPRSVLATDWTPSGLCARAKLPVSWTDPSPHRVRFVPVGPGVRLEVLDWGGSGPPLLFLSGLQDVAHGFDDFAPEFTDRFHVLAITRRGYGASSQPPSGYDLDTRVADLRAALDSLRLSRVALVGHSIAGDECTAFAGRFPERVSGLVYLDAAYDHSGVRALMQASPPPPPMLSSDSAAPGAVQAYLLRAYGMRIPEAQLRAIARYDSTGKLMADVTPGRIDSLVIAGTGHPDYQAVRTPALAIYAVTDSAPQVFPTWPTLEPAARAAARHFTLVLQRWAATERARFRHGLRSGQVLELHGANHYVYFSHTPEVTRAMRDFLERTGQSTGP